MISDLPIFMARCLVFTVLIECAFAFILGISQIKSYIIILLVNIMTNPVLVSVAFTVRLICPISVYYITLAALETCAILAEGAVYRKTVSWRNSPFLLSFILNAFSFLIGEVLNKLVF